MLVPQNDLHVVEDVCLWVPSHCKVETFLLLLALKAQKPVWRSLFGVFLRASLQVRYPDRIMLIRGNHESRQITQAETVLTGLRAWFSRVR